MCFPVVVRLFALFVVAVEFQRGLSPGEQLYMQIFSKLQVLHLLALSIAVSPEALLARDLLHHTHGDLVYEAPHPYGWAERTTR
jgi:hypothetical protein